MRATLDQRAGGPFRIWRPPVNGVQYIVGIDTAEGIVRDRGAFRRTAILYRNERPDYSCAIVIEKETGRHCATWHGDVPVTEWGYICAGIGFHYGRALLVPEVNGPGIEVVNTLAKRVRYPRLYRNRQMHVVAGDDLLPRWGWQTSHTSRPRLIARVHEILADDPQFTQDFELIREIGRVQVDESGVARARHPDKDDRVLALAIALQARWEAHHEAPPTDQRDADLAHLPAYDQGVWRRWRDQTDGSHRAARPGRLFGAGPLRSL